MLKVHAGDVHASVLETDEKKNLSATAKTDDEKSALYTFESYTVPLCIFKDYFDCKTYCVHMPPVISDFMLVI